MRLGAVNGRYSPSFFNIHLETDEDLASVLESHICDQTFAHEFLHYLQDVALPYNIRMLLTHLSLLSDVQGQCIKKGYLSLPFNSWRQNSLDILNQLSYTFGRNQFIDSAERLISVESEFCSSPDTGLRVFWYKARVRGHDDISIEYQLGARDMLEYLVYKIESKHYSYNAPRLPYETIDLLFEFYGFSKIEDSVRMLIVEYCLHNDNPMHFLISTFLDGDFIKINEGMFENYDSAKQLLSTYGWEARGGFSESLFSKTERRLKDFSMYLSQTFGQRFDDVEKWIEKVSSYAKNVLSGKFLFSDLYSNNIEYLFDTINEAIKNIGIPMILNKSEQCVCLLPQGTDTNQFAQFYVLQNFFSQICSGERQCPVEKFCRSSGELRTDECAENPFSKLTDEEACPYTLFLRIFGMGNIEFRC